MRNILPVVWMVCYWGVAQAQPYTPVFVISSESQNQPFFSAPRGMVTDQSGDIYIADAGSNQVKKYDSDGTFIMQWGALGTQSSQFNQPYDVTIDTAGNLFVVDRGNRRIQKFSPDGQYMLSFGVMGTGNGEFLDPAAVTCSPDGFLFVVEDGVGARVQKFDLDGNFILKWGSFGMGNTQFLSPSGIAISEQGQVLVSDSGGGAIKVFDENGIFLTVINTESGGNPLLGPSDLEVDSRGNIFVLQSTQASDRILRYNKNFNYIEDAGMTGAGDGQFQRPNGIAIDTFGNIYVSDIDRQDIQKFSGGLIFLTKFGTGASTGNGQLNRPESVAIAKGRKIVVADRGNQRVQLFNPNGTFDRIIGGPGFGDGTFQAPISVAADTAGNLFVADSVTDVIQKFFMDGQFLNSELSTPFDILGLEVAPDGTHFITVIDTINTTRAGVRIISSTGQQLELFGQYGTGFTEFLNPYGITRDSSGNIYVSDATKNAILKFDADGRFVMRWGSLGGFPGMFDQPTGLAIDHRGNLLVADRGNHRIQKFDTSGKFIAAYGRYGSRPGEFFNPSDVAADANGRIYVADRDNNRVQVFNTCSYTTNQNVSICEGETYDFNGQVLTDPGNYKTTFLTTDGCDSTVSLNLIVVPTVRKVIDTALCAGDSIFFDSVQIKLSGTYIDTIPSAVSGCDSIVTLILEIVDSFNISTNLNICLGDTIEFGGQKLFASGNYKHTFLSKVGCDSTVNLALSVLDTFRTQRRDTLCLGDTLQVNGQPFFASGAYEITFPGNDRRCDSVVELSLTVLDTFFIRNLSSICRGDTLEYQGEKLYESGSYFFHFPPTDTRCDSTVEIRLTVLDTFNHIVTDTICPRQRIRLGPLTLTEPGVYFYTFPPNSRRCDSTVQLNLIGQDFIQVTRFDTICQGDTLFFDTLALTRRGRYTIRFPETNTRCDSIVTVNLRIRQPVSSERFDTICLGDTLFYGDLEITQPGRYRYTFPPEGNRCDSTVLLNVQTLDTFYQVRYDTICLGETLTVGDLNLTSSGVYRYAYPPTKERCDSTVEIRLSVLPRVTVRRRETICEGDSIQFDGRSLTTAGNYEQTFPPNALRCDSVISLQLSVNPSYDRTFDFTICQGDSVVGENRIFRKTGSFLFHYKTAESCDSSITYNVTVLDTFYTVIDTAICVGERLQIGNNIVSSAGTFITSFPSNSSRCDSIVEIRVSVLDTFFNEVFMTICDGERLEFGDRSLRRSGTYIHTFPPTDSRCDSTVLLNLEVLEPVRDTMQMDLCLGDTIRIGDQMITNAGTYDIILQGKRGCDSLLHVEAGIRPVARSMRTARICEGEFFSFGGRLLSRQGIYYDTLQAANGCDSIIALDLGVEQVLVSRREATICEGESYFFGNRDLTQTGIYRDSFLAQTGCFFYLVLDLTVEQAAPDTTFATICEGDSIFFDGEIYSEPGMYSKVYASNSGCDSIRILELRVLPQNSDSLNVNLCEGESILFGDSTLQRSGTFRDTLENRLGCDSVITMRLQVFPTYNDTLNINWCGAEPFDLGGQLIDIPGIYSYTFTSADNCDSTVTVNLDVHPIDTTITIGGILLTANAENVSYQWINCADTSVVVGATSQFFIPDENGSYAVILRNDSCVFVSECMEVLITDTEDFDISGAFTLYPNPATDQLILEVTPEFTGSYQWEVLNIQAQSLLRGDLQLLARNTFDIADLPPGLYTLLFRNEEGQLGRLRFSKISR